MNDTRRWVFFDLDGTLADSLPGMYRAYENFLGGYERQGTRDEFEELNGPSLPEIVAILKTRYGLTDGEDALMAAYKKHILDVYRHIVKPMRDAAEVLRSLTNRGYRLLLVTSADRDVATEFIRSQDWTQYFTNFLFGDDTFEAKPSSEIYNLAVKKAAAQPDAVVVVEDSCNGVISAKGAGPYVIGLEGNQTKESLLQAGADITISRLGELLLLLKPLHE